MSLHRKLLMGNGTEIQTSEIKYMTNDGNPLTLDNAARFYANVSGTNTATLLSNTYEDGIGTLVFDKPIVYLYRSFYNCTNLRQVSLPDSVTVIGDSVFSNCNNIILHKLPNYLATIGSYTFSRNQTIKSIEIPSTVTNMGYSPFLSCTGMTMCFLMPLTPPITPNNIELFRYCYKLSTIYVPLKSVELYKSTDNWKDYADIIQGF